MPRLRNTAAPVQPLRRNMQGAYGWCSASAGPRHFTYLDWQCWPAPDDGAALPICGQCALALMAGAGLGTRLPYESEICPQFGGQFKTRRPPSGRKTQAEIGTIGKVEQKRRQRREAIRAALGSGSKSWVYLAQLRAPDGTKYFPSRQAAQQFMWEHMKGDYLSIRQAGCGTGLVRLLAAQEKSC